MTAKNNYEGSRDEDLWRTYKSILKLSADYPEELRVMDVDRVMSAAFDQGPEILRGFAAWLLGNVTNSRVITEISNWSPGES